MDDKVHQERFHSVREVKTQMHKRRRKRKGESVSVSTDTQEREGDTGERATRFPGPTQETGPKAG